jgi:hypothetical protein
MSRTPSRQRVFAERCLQAGREVYQVGREKAGVQQGNSHGAPYRYAESTWADDMEWGAAELYQATGERHFLEEAKRYARLIGFDFLAWAAGSGSAPSTRLLRSRDPLEAPRRSWANGLMKPDGGRTEASWRQSRHDPECN